MAKSTRFMLMLPVVLLLSTAFAAFANVEVQCPGDTDGDGIIDTPDPNHPNARCMHLAAGDGFVTMGDERPMYIFSFSDITGYMPEMAVHAGMLAASFPAPAIILDEGDEFYLNLTNVGMMVRPDLFDPHTVHYHGFPQAAPVFDGVPDASISIKMMSSLTYYYNIVEPGTYMYHCHVEATEHMQMGMLGNLYVRPAQNRLPDGALLGEHVHSNPDWNADRNLDDPTVGDKYVYNDGDGSTRYDVEKHIQIGSFDSAFHDASEGVQPLPFAAMHDNYPMLNGRGYPHTVDTASYTAIAPPEGMEGMFPEPRYSQNEHSLITATAGDRILLRLSNLNVTRFYTLISPSISMTVVGQDARVLKNYLTGENLYYNTHSITLGGGQAYDLILDTTDVPAGTYFIYAANLNYLSNNEEDFGGMMTELVINPANP